MAVWNSTSLIDIYSTHRIDSEFFRPDYFFAEAQTRQCKTEDLGRLGSFTPGPFGSAFHVRNYDFQSPYRYIRGRDVKPFFLLEDDNRYIPSSDFHRLQKYAVRAADLMISVVGTLGNVAICTEEETPAMFSCKSTLFRSTGVDPYYLLAYLNCKYGHLCLQRRQRGAVQTGLNIEDLRTIPVPRFGEKIESAISENIYTAQLNLKLSQDTYQKGQHLLESELGLNNLNFQKPAGYMARFSTVGLSDTFSAGRIDSQCFAPNSLFYEKWLGMHASCNRLGHLLQCTAKGRQQVEFSQGDTDYSSIKHISGRELVGASKCFPSTDSPIARTNDLLLAITGATIGKIGIVKRYNRLAFSGDLFMLRAKSEIEPHYLLLVLDHKIGQVQFTRWITGSTNGHLAPRDVGRVLIPRLDENIENQIAELVKKSLCKRIASEQLLDQAKIRVEQLIEEAVRGENTP
jgi:type I restriction enzyme, S subunit